MKVLIVPSWYCTEDKPNNGIFFKEQARALINSGLRVCVLYPDLRFRLGGLRRGLFSVPGDVPTLFYRRRTLTPFAERGRWPQREWMLERLYARAAAEFGVPDIVHLHSCRMGVETLGLCGRHNLPLVYTEHYTGVMGTVPRALQTEFEKTCRRCDRALAVSGALLKKMKIYRPDAEYLPNLVDTEKFRVLSAYPDDFTVGAVGNLIARKGYDKLIRAFSRVSGKMPGAKLLIAGEGPERPALEALISSFELNEKVKLCGFLTREEAPAFFNRCSCVACSSTLETFGMTLIESLACGRPLLSFRCGGPESIVAPGNGILIENGDEAALAQGMLTLYQNREKYDPYKISAGCAEKFGAKAVAAHLTEIYREVLSHKKVGM